MTMHKLCAKDQLTGIQTMKAAGNRTCIITLIPAFMANFIFIQKTGAKNIINHTLQPTSKKVYFVHS